MQDVLDFISHFKGAETTFLHGCCYWFAWILKQHFNDMYLVEILHDPIEGHFVAEFWREDFEFPKLFDIRGDVTALYNRFDLDNLRVLKKDDYKYYSRLMDDCRDFICYPEPPDSKVA